MTNAQYIAWRKRSDARRCLLVEAQYYDITTATLKTEYVSNFGYVTTSSDSPADVCYDDRIINEVYIRYKKDEPNTVSEIQLININGDLDHWMERGWDGRSIKFYLGDPDWPRADFRLHLEGMIKEAVISEQAFILRIRDEKEALNNPLHVATYVGTDSAGQMMPTGLGKNFNVTPVLISQALHAYQVHARVIHAVNDVKDNGVSVGFTYDLPSAQIFLTAQPFGAVTVDFQGEAFGGYASTIADIVERVMLYKGVSPSKIDAVSFTEFNTLFPFETGRFITDQVNTIALIDELLKDVNGGWYFADGKFRLWYLRNPTGVYKHIVDDDDYITGSFNVSSVDTPVWKMKFGVQRNNTVQSADGLAGALTEIERKRLSTEYYDVRPIEDTDVKTAHPLAIESDIKPTYFAAAAGLSTEFARQMAMQTSPHLYFSIKCNGYTPQTLQLDLRLGDEVLVSIGRAGFSSFNNAYRLKTLGELDWGVDPLGAYTLTPGGLTSTAILIGVTEYITTGFYELDFRK